MVVAGAGVGCWWWLLVDAACCDCWNKRRLGAADGGPGMERPNTSMASSKPVGSGLDVMTSGEEVCFVEIAFLV